VNLKKIFEKVKTSHKKHINSKHVD